jgi:glycosyltransferase involved in cell wall biosynthesis
MNILILTEKYPPDAGGLAISTRRLAHGLPVDRIGIHRRADDTLAAWFDHVVALHAAQPFDLIHALYLTHPAFVAVSAARYLDIPSVASARGNDLDRTAFDSGRFAQVAWSLQHASAVTAVTQDLARKARAFAPGCAVQVVPNGVDAARFTPGPRDAALAEALGLGDAPVIAFIGEARQKKGITILLPAFAALCARSPRPPALLLVGDVRKDDAPVIDVFRRQNPALAVRLVPQVAHAELPAYYRLADVLAIPSLRDGMPNTLLEGMACGCAVIASATGGIPDVLGRGGAEDGVLVPPGDAAALAGALEALLADPARRARIGAAARGTVEREFTPEREVERNVAVYRGILGGAE